MPLLNLGLQNLALIRKPMPEWAEAAVATVGSMKGMCDANDSLEKKTIAKGRADNWQLLKAAIRKISTWLMTKGNLLLLTQNGKDRLM